MVKKSMGLVMFCAIVIVFSSALAMEEMVLEEARITIGDGALNMGGIFQATWEAQKLDEEFGNWNNTFGLNRARLLMWGNVIPDKVRFFAQTEFLDSLSILDLAAIFNYIPKTDLVVGRFFSGYTLYMSSHTGKLEMIKYPFTTSQMPVWRQIGFQTTTTTEFTDVYFGLFNGADQPNSLTDNNDAKDLFFRADLKPTIGNTNIRVGAYAWVGFAKPVFGTETVPNPKNETLKNNRFGGFVKSDYSQENMTFKLRGEFVYGQMEMLQSADVADVVSIDGYTFMAHMGFMPDPRIEFLLRYEGFDPSTDISDNEVYALTGGLNYYLDGIFSMIYLNYIHNMESGVDIQNDEVLLQVQVLF